MPRSTSSRASDPTSVLVFVGANDVTHRVTPTNSRPPPRASRPSAARARGRGHRRHLPRPRHREAPPPAAAADRSPVVTAARGGPDDHRRRGRRSRRVARVAARPGVRPAPPGLLQLRPLPPLVARLPAPGRGPAARRSAQPWATAPSRSPSWTRGGTKRSCRCPRRPSRRRTPPAASSWRSRSTATTGRRAVAGPPSGTASRCRCGGVPASEVETGTARTASSPRATSADGRRRRRRRPVLRRHSA